MIYLLCEKWRGSIHTSSFRYFKTIEDLEAHIRTQAPEHWSGGEPWHVYQVHEDGTESKALTLKECRAIGLRPGRT